MKIKLGKNSYGKNAINLSKIIRHQNHHEFRQISVNVVLGGDFETAHTQGDNTLILPTDTQKNTVYALAKEHFTSSIEAFAIVLAHHFFTNNKQVSDATVEITEHLWTHMDDNGIQHPHAYVSAGQEKRFTAVSENMHGVKIVSGIKDLLILKTTDSAFEKYIVDSFTTLKETSDRIMCTNCEATWEYNGAESDFTEQYESIRTCLLKTFAAHKSLSVQHTLYDMGVAVLEQHNAIKEISFIMPNKHHIPFNLQPFGIENNNEIFMATDEPYGYITGTITRG